MSGFDWRSLIKTAAPFLGTALGGPMGGVAGSLIAKALGGDETKATADDLAKLCQNVTPEQLLALKNAEQEFAIRLKAMDINEVKDLEALAVQDRTSAREREIKTGDSWTPRILAGFVVLAWIGLNWFLVSHSMLKPGQSTSLDSNMEPMLMRILGTLDAALTFVLSYYFGSSAGNARKDDMLHASMKAPAPKE